MVELQWGIVGVNLVPRLVPGFRDKARVDGVFRSTSEIVGGKLLFRVYSVSGNSLIPRLDMRAWE